LKTIALILSGGVGTRMGSNIPKQYIEIGGKPILYHAVKAFQDHEDVDAIVIAADEAWEEYILKLIKAHKINKFVGFSKPGKTRQHTVLYGYEKIRELGYADDSVVMIQDGVRPFTTKQEIRLCSEEIQKCDYVLPATPPVDTVFVSEDGQNITGLLNRSTLRCGATPETMRLGPLLDLCERLSDEEISTVTNFAALAVKYGLSCHTVEGNPRNFKVTTAEDIVRLKMYLADKK